MPNVILNYIIVVILVFCLIGLISVIDSYLKKKNEILQYQVDIAYTPHDKSSSQILEEFISECFTEYQVLVLIPMNELYIGPEREQQICTDLATRVANHISPHFLNILYRQYNKLTIHDIIGDKIYMMVTGYVVEHNQSIDTSPK